MDNLIILGLLFLISRKKKPSRALKPGKVSISTKLVITSCYVCVVDSTRGNIQVCRQMVGKEQ